MQRQCVGSAANDQLFQFAITTRWRSRHSSSLRLHLEQRVRPAFAALHWGGPMQHTLATQAGSLSAPMLLEGETKRGNQKKLKSSRRTPRQQPNRQHHNSSFRNRQRQSPTRSHTSPPPPAPSSRAPRPIVKPPLNRALGRTRATQICVSYAACDPRDAGVRSA